ALEVGPPLAPRDRVQPHARAVPHEPQRGDVRTVVADGRDGACAFRREVLVALFGRHRDLAAASLFLHQARPYKRSALAPAIKARASSSRLTVASSSASVTPGYFASGCGKSDAQTMRSAPHNGDVA